ncbi:MAG: hypothetical protein K2Y22_03985 [Candidatus Obscuribacterales bacterium]|nr:hypothetical protein [Candidatus Obscuribacterales bacterium]
MGRLLVLAVTLGVATTVCPDLLDRPSGFATLQSASATSPQDIVDFNTHSLKYHDPNCIWAKRCTVNCIKISRKEAKQRGGVPCKVCGGGE